MKVLAMYLPQFHKVKENDEWWGEGFTEWTSVKAAESLYEGHKQPVVPYNENYYDLTEKATMQWQADLMKQYGVDGVCMYHYWFKEGRQILEKPAENLLQWKEIDMPFCFCWANETWARTWSGLQNVNVWASTLEKKTTDGKRILLEQKYGDKKEWIVHFEYLLDFFKDERYIKVDNKPIFMIYRPELMPCVERMFSFWNQLAIKAGFEGIYLIGGDRGAYSRSYDAIFEKILFWEPIYDVGKLGPQKDEKKSGVMTLKYEDVWNGILTRGAASSKRVYSGVVGYDDTPRRGEKGLVIEGATPEKFARYFTELLAKNAAIGNDLVFLNAWNEWGEGMYLEPDTINGFACLKAIADAKNNYKIHIDKYKKLHEQSNAFRALSAEARYKHYFNLFEKWISLQGRNMRLQDYFLKKGYHSVAIYGYGPFAKLLALELEGSCVKIEYIIDKNKEQKDCEYPVFNLEDLLSPVDIVVIAATFSCSVIFKALWEKGYYNVISLEEIIMEEW